MHYDSKLEQEVTIVVGDIIDYKEKTSLEILYRKMFSLEEEGDPS